MICNDRLNSTTFSENEVQKAVQFFIDDYAEYFFKYQTRLEFTDELKQQDTLEGIYEILEKYDVHDAVHVSK